MFVRSLLIALFWYVLRCVVSVSCCVCGSLVWFRWLVSCLSCFVLCVCVVFVCVLCVEFRVAVCRFGLLVCVGPCYVCGVLCCCAVLW